MSEIQVFLLRYYVKTEFFLTGAAIVGPNYITVAQQEERQHYVATYTNANTTWNNPSGPVTYGFVTRPPNYANVNTTWSNPYGPVTYRFDTRPPNYANVNTTWSNPYGPVAYRFVTRPPTYYSFFQPQEPAPCRCICQQNHFDPQPMSVEDLNKEQSTSTSDLIVPSPQTSGQVKNEVKIAETPTIVNVQVPKSEDKPGESTQKSSDNDDIISLSSLRGGQKSVVFEEDIVHLLQKSRDCMIAPLGRKLTISPVPSKTNMSKASKESIKPVPKQLSDIFKPAEEKNQEEPK